MANNYSQQYQDYINFCETLSYHLGDSAQPLMSFHQWLASRSNHNRSIDYQIGGHANQPVAVNSNSQPSVIHTHRPSVLSSSQFFSNDSSTEDKTVTEKKQREPWSNQQTNVLVNLWTENLKVLESSKCNDMWHKIVKEVNKHGPVKDMKKCKKKILNLKENYKKAKTNNKKSGSSPDFCPFYEEFDRVLSARDIINIPALTEVGANDETPREYESSSKPDSDVDDKSDTENSSICDGEYLQWDSFVTHGKM